MSKLGDRFNEGKPQWSLVPQSALVPMVRVLEYGKNKYSAWNWAKGLKISEICESLKRHLDAFMEGEDKDSESGLSHIGHLQCNALFLSWMMENKPELDDRYFKKEEKDMFTGNKNNPFDLQRDVGFTTAIIWNHCSESIIEKYKNEGCIAQYEKASEIAVDFVTQTQNIKDWEEYMINGKIILEIGKNKVIIKGGDYEEFVINFTDLKLKLR